MMVGLDANPRLGVPKEAIKVVPYRIAVNIIGLSEDSWRRFNWCPGNHLIFDYVVAGGWVVSFWRWVDVIPN